MGYQQEQTDEFVKYRLNTALTSKNAEKIAANLREILQQGKVFKFLIFDLDIHDIDPNCFRHLIPLASELKKSNCQAFVVTKDPKTIRSMNSLGVSSVLKPVKSLEEIIPFVAAKSSGKIDVDLVNPFIQGTIETLQVQCQLETSTGNIFLRKADTPMPQTDIAGVIGIKSAKFAGNINVAFPEATFLKIMSRMLGEDLTEMNKDLEDGAGELLNMISGHAKKLLGQSGIAIERAIPKVLSREAWKESSKLSDSEVMIILPFESEAGYFQIEICPK